MGPKGKQDEVTLLFLLGRGTFGVGAKGKREMEELCFFQQT